MAYKDSIKIVKKTNSKRRKIPNILEPGFVAPDGGWGWVIVVTSGLCNVFCLATLVCFGLIFRDRLQQLGINASQTSTILNMNVGVASFVGLANGPIFRKFSYRQAGFVGGIVCAVAICVLSFMSTFYGILISFSILYASGKSIAMSASTLALITYFKKKRSLAVAMSWAFSGIGSILTPQVTTLLMGAYGMSGTVLIFSAFALNSLACALVLQPVQWHAKKETDCKILQGIGKEEGKEKGDELKTLVDKTVSTTVVKRRDKRASSDEMRSNENNNQPEVEVDMLRTSMICYPEDVLSLTSYETAWNENHRPTSLGGKSSSTVLDRGSTDQNFNREITEISKSKQSIAIETNIAENIECAKNDDEKQEKNCSKNVYDNEEPTTEQLLSKDANPDSNKPENIHPSLCARAFHSVAVFFDLDLLQDLIFVNLAVGINFAFFTEINFTLLTPYILSEYGLTDASIATVMSILAGVDVLTRIIISFITARVQWSERTYLLIGIAFSSVGRIILAHVHTYAVIMTVAVFCGIGKALVIIFSSLVIPGYVPLEKLPGATGLQLVVRGIMFLGVGPIAGWIRDTSGNYTLMLHFLNIFSYSVIVSWILINYCQSRKRRLERTKDANV